MSRRDPAAAGGGRCGQQNGLNDVMPELLRIDAQGAVELLDIPGVDFTNLRVLMREQQQAISGGPDVSERVKDMIVTRFLVDEVKTDAREILGPMFAIPEDIEPTSRNRVIDCILNSLIQDLSVFRSIQMTGTLFLKAFYKNNVFRVAIAASFVGSAFYVTWISGLGSLCRLGIDGCQIVLSALAACYNLIANPGEFMVQFNLLLGEPISVQIADFIRVLNENVATPALFAGLVAQGNVSLLELLYRQPVAPVHLVAAAGAQALAQEEGHLENLRDAINAEIARLEAERAPGAGAAGAPGAGAAGAAGAPGAGAAGDPLPALIVARDSINGAIAAIPAAAAAAVPAPAPDADAANRSLFDVMLRELRRAGGVISIYVKRYVLNLYNYLNRVRQIFPGVVGPAGTDFLSYSCNVFLQNRIISLFGIISAQFTNAGISERQTLLSTLLEYILPSNLRWSVFRGDDYSASKELGILVFRLKPRILDCLTRIGLPRPEANALLESCTLFTSTLTEDNLAHFVTLMPQTLLQRIFLPEVQPVEAGGGSLTPGPAWTPLLERLSTLQTDMNDLFRKNPSQFFSPEELSQFELIFGTGFKRIITRMLNVQPCVLLSSVAESAQCTFMHNVVARDVALLEQPAVPTELSLAHQKFFPLENLFSGMFNTLFSCTTEVIDAAELARESLNDQEIQERVNGKLKIKLRIKNDDAHADEKVAKFIKDAFFGFKVGCFWNPMRCSFTPAIGFKNGVPLAIMVLDIKSTTVQVNPITQLIQDQYKVPISFLESGGVFVPQQVADAVSGLKTAVTDNVASALSFAWRGISSLGRSVCSSLPSRRSVAIEGQLEAVAEAIQPNIHEVAVEEEQEMEGLAAEPKQFSYAVVNLDQEAQLNEILDKSQQRIVENDLTVNMGVQSHEEQSRISEEQLRGLVREGLERQALAAEIADARRMAHLSEYVPDIREQTLKAAAFQPGEAAGDWRYNLLVPQPMEQGGVGVIQSDVHQPAVEPYVPAAFQPGAAVFQPAAAAVFQPAEAEEDRRRDGARSRSPSPKSTTRTEDTGQTKSKRTSAQGSSRKGSSAQGKREGGSRTRRRRSSSSTRSSTTRGRKATSRRNQSKKHKQNSRRRRSTRKSSRKN
jgi:hypothetical protein